jgi:hypothetical protein
MAHEILPEGDWNGSSEVMCCPAGIVATDGGAAVTVTGGGATTVTVVAGGAAVGVGVDIVITGTSVGDCAVVAPVDGVHAASASAARPMTSS